MRINLINVRVNMTMWLVPFKGRNHSGCYKQNFLWKKDNVYIMDNHRAALWCWLQHLSEVEKVNFFHIDKHTDTLLSRLNEWVAACPDVRSISIEDYLSLVHERVINMDIPLFRWDNYASIFLEKYKNLVGKCIFSTHGDGDEPNYNKVMAIDIWDTARIVDYWLKDSTNKWIVNIDLDYFFYESDVEEYARFFSDNYVSQLFTTVKKYLEAGNLACLTLCLSPEYCGGWDAAKKLCEEAVGYLGLEFSLS